MSNSLPSALGQAAERWTLDRLLHPAALLAHVPMLAEWAKNMWHKEHYQFFPLLLGFVAWRLVQAWSDEADAGKQPGAPVVVGAQEAGDTVRRTVRQWGGNGTRVKTGARVLLTLDLLLVGLSALAFSPFLVIPALMLLIASAFIAHQGWDSFQRKIAPTWLLLVFIIPLPLNWDLQLIQKLQFLVSQLASWMLDSVGQIHFRNGVVLATLHNNFLAEEACSGIRSLFSSLSVMAIYGVTRQYSLRRHLFNQLQTMLWVLAGNGIRVALTIWIADHWTLSIASGPAHEALGLAVFLLIFLLALSTDRILDLRPESEQLTESG